MVLCRSLGGWTASGFMRRAMRGLTHSRHCPLSGVKMAHPYPQKREHMHWEKCVCVCACVCVCLNAGVPLYVDFDQPTMSV